MRNREFFARFVAPSDAGELLGAWAGTVPTGFATLYWTFSSVSAVDVVLLNDLFVAPEHRGAGTGRALLAAAADRATARRAHRLEWATAPDNAAARRLYDGVGAVASEWMHYELELGEP